MTIIFVTDQSGDHAGWKIRYSSTGEGRWVSVPSRKLFQKRQGATYDGTLPCQAWEAQGRKKFSLILLGSLAGSEKSTDKDTVIGEKHPCLVHVSFPWHGK